jgi:hypothetical protein
MFTIYYVAVTKTSSQAITANTMIETTIEKNKYSSYSVYEFGTYPESSVLAGQTKKQFLDMFDTEEAAQAEYPNAELGYRDAHNHFDHLPDREDH